MAKQAVGLLETRGLACLVVGVDAMLKSANVELVGPMKQIGNAMCNAVVTGDVAAVKAALDAGALGYLQKSASRDELLAALQHVQANPDEVCPAGWKPGEKTMNPTPEGSKEFFKSL